MPATLTKPLDYDDYVRLPDDGKRYEIINGALTIPVDAPASMSPSPSYFHQRAHRVLFRALANHAAASGGEVLSAPIDVILGPHEIVVPDIVFVSEARRGLLEKKGVVGSPDLVVEILSPSTRARDLNEKRVMYERFGVHAYWVVDLDAEQVLAWKLTEGRYGEPTTLFGTDALTSALLPGFALPAKDLFV